MLLAAICLANQPRAGLTRSPTRGELALHAFVGHLDFCRGLLGLVDGPGLQAQHRQNKESQHQKWRSGIAGTLLVVGLFGGVA